jgi:HD-GYP domain-containing protein (c-di-GMP phosphodiesterase class II)
MASKEDGNIQKTAGEIVNQLSIVLKTALIHDPSNIAVITAVEKLFTLMKPIMESEKSITLQLSGEFFYMNESRIRYSLEFLLNFDFLIKEFRKRELGKVAFTDPLKSDDILIFSKAFVTAGFSDSPFVKMSEILEASDAVQIDLLKKIVEDRLKKVNEGEEVNTRRFIKKTYFNAVSYTKGVLIKIKSGQKVDLKKAKRIVESMVDQLLEDEQFLLSLTAIKDFDEYTYHHMVNVSILSMSLGQRLGLSRQALTELGLAALFHDIGKLEIPYELLNKPSSFTDEEWKIIKKHPIWGVKAILGLGRFNSSAIRALIVSFEHHLYCDFSGYPKVKKYRELDLYSRLVTLADQYDAMTSARVYKRTPMSPDKSLSIMLEGTGSQLDPLLFKFFTNMVGIYPIGTIVMLNTKEIGLVYECNAAFADRPRVLIIIDSQGKSVRGPVEDLSEKDETGRHIRTIMKTLDSNKYKINLAEYLL